MGSGSVSCRLRRWVDVRVRLSSMGGLGMRHGMRLHVGGLSMRLRMLRRNGGVSGVPVWRGGVLRVVSRHLATLRIQDKG